MSQNEMSQNELMHHGVKGMRWGHRKASYNTGSGVGRSKSGQSNSRNPVKVDAKSKKAADKAAAKESVKRGREISRRIIKGEILTNEESSGILNKRRYYDTVSKKTLSDAQIKDLKKYRRDVVMKTVSLSMAGTLGSMLIVGLMD